MSGNPNTADLTLATELQNAIRDVVGLEFTIEECVRLLARLDADAARRAAWSK